MALISWGSVLDRRILAFETIPRYLHSRNLTAAAGPVKNLGTLRCYFLLERTECARGLGSFRDALGRDLFDHADSDGGAHVSDGEPSEFWDILEGF